MGKINLHGKLSFNIQDNGAAIIGELDQAESEILFIRIHSYDSQKNHACMSKFIPNWEAWVELLKTRKLNETELNLLYNNSYGLKVTIEIQDGQFDGNTEYG